jgi:hypothetical protein
MKCWKPVRSRPHEREFKPVVNADGWWNGLVRDRFQAVLELVLDAIADDYESVEIILQTINEWDRDRDPESWAARRAVPISRPEVVSALQELTREGFAQAYLFSGDETHAVDFREGEVADLWFLATQKGIDAVRQFLGSEYDE